MEKDDLLRCKNKIKGAAAVKKNKKQLMEKADLKFPPFGWSTLWVANFSHFDFSRETRNSKPFLARNEKKREIFFMLVRSFYLKN